MERNEKLADRVTTAGAAHVRPVYELPAERVARQRPRHPLMDETVTAILAVSTGALLLALLIPRLAVTLEELTEALW